MTGSLELELQELQECFEDKQYKHKSDINDLQHQICKLQDCLSKSKKLETFSSQAYNTNIQELYYTLISMRLPLRKIKQVVKAVITRLMPHVDSSKIRLPGKSCAAYMRSADLATISRAHKAAQLIQSKQWHLSSDNTASGEKVCVLAQRLSHWCS